jgi:putative ABC transport system permease protein
LRVAAPEDSGDLARLTDSFHLNLTAFGFLSFVVGLFIVYSAIGLAFEQRKHHLAHAARLRRLRPPADGLLVAELGRLALLAGASGWPRAT